MSLADGTRIGSYEILALLGAGGMGEVYRARDTRLGRVVAIKALPQAYSSDPERLARFEREAQLLASLNHPNIGAIYGLEDVAGTPYLVLEFIEGESLLQRLQRGPLSVRETLDVGGQIAAAVEAAHERGVVHRDLKPGNVMLLPSNTVKVLDFGLAKGGALEHGSSLDLASSPTVAISTTGAGVILGTAAYMSPEQARGKIVDRRADVWAFGCVLFECLTGRQPFGGETVSDVIARVLEREPDWSLFPAAAPAPLRDIITRCLLKNAEQRARDIGDLRRQMSALAMELSTPQSGIAAAASALPSLAVLYFENLASDSESEYFCAGITEDILTDLSKIKGLRVASRNAVARFRGAPADIPKIAAELGVQAVLEGSVRRSGERVRISAQLINAADGFHLWAERYDRTLQDVFAVQEEIAAAITDALRVALTPAETKNLVHNRPTDAHAYDLYLKGRAQYGLYTIESMRAALALFEQAIAVDPTYALAYAGIGDCYGQFMQLEAAPDIASFTRLGLEAARRATALDPKLAEGYKAEALVLRFSGDAAGELVALKKALDVNPRFTPALNNIGVEAICSADMAEAERMFRRVVEIDPQDGFASGLLGVVLLFTRRYDEAVANSMRVLATTPSPLYLTWSYCNLAWAQVLRGDLEKATRAIGEARQLGAEETNVRAIEALVFLRAGRLEEASQIVRQLRDHQGIGGSPLFALGETATVLGESELATAYFTRRLVRDMMQTLSRLMPPTHALFDREPFAPRRRDVALIWPLEAPMIDPASFAMFREVRIESALPVGSEVLRK